jgi:hypothetical protein
MEFMLLNNEKSVLDEELRDAKTTLDKITDKSTDDEKVDADKAYQEALKKNNENKVRFREVAALCNKDAKSLKITFSSKIHLNSDYENIYNTLKTAKYAYKFSGFMVNNPDSILIMKPVPGFAINVKIDTRDKCIRHILGDLRDTLSNEISTINKSMTDSSDELEKNELNFKLGLVNSELSKLNKLLELNELSQSNGGYSRRNRRNTNHSQRNRNSKRGYLTTTRKSRNQQKQTKNRKRTWANCRSMRR